MKIAVIGSGVAGLAAAWCLSRSHEIVVYERDARAGGHAVTVDVPSEPGQTTPVDAGFIVFDEWTYPQLTALFRTLGVRSTMYPVSVGVSVAGDEWSVTCHDTPFWARVADEAARFTLAAPEVAGLDPGLSIGAYLASEGYSDDFARKCLLPMMSYLFVTRTGLLRMPACLVGGLFRRNLSFYAPVLWRAVAGGSREYVRRMTRDLEARIRLDCTAVAVRRDPKAVVVRDAEGREERFDEVVLACNAEEARGLLADADPDEARALSLPRFQAATMVVHRNAAVLPKNPRIHSTVNYVRATDGEPGPGELAGLMTTVEERCAVYRTLDPPVSAVPWEERLAELRFSHVVCDSAYLVSVNEIGRLQGRNRTWYCGGHLAVLPYHETALLSGLLVANALGADYPFPHEPRARQAFAFAAEEFRRRRASSVSGAAV